MQGICCTNTCENRNTCKITRVKLVIPTIAVDAGKIAKGSRKLTGLSIDIDRITMDSDLNELSGMYTNSDLPVLSK